MNIIKFQLDEEPKVVPQKGLAAFIRVYSDIEIFPSYKDIYR